MEPSESGSLRDTDPLPKVPIERGAVSAGAW